MPIMILSAGDTSMGKADRNVGSLSLKGVEGNCCVTIMHICLALYILQSIFFIHVLILFPTEVFTMRQVLLLLSFNRYANQCSCPRDEGTPQAHPAPNGFRDLFLVVVV